MEKEYTEKVESDKSAPVVTDTKLEPSVPEEVANNEKAPENNSTSACGSRITKSKQSPIKSVAKKKRQKPPKDINAPKHPLTGYVRYMNEIRESMRHKNPSLTPIELTKIMAEEWSKLSEEKKKPYLEAAEADKERYYKELSEYKLNNDARAKTKPYNAPPISKDLPMTKDPASSLPYVNGKVEPNTIRRGDYDIPIFTEDFLDHNKVVDTELRTLRKSNIDYEQQNSVLEKHVENMEKGILKLEYETNNLDARNGVLENYLHKLRTTLANALQSLPVVSECSGATIENIDQYLGDLHQKANSSTQGHTLNKAKDIIRKLDIQNLTS